MSWFVNVNKTKISSWSKLEFAQTMSKNYTPGDKTDSSRTSSYKNMWH